MPSVSSLLDPIPAAQQLANWLADKIDPRDSASSNVPLQRIKGFLAGGVKGAIESNSSPLDILANLAPYTKAAVPAMAMATALKGDKSLWHGTRALLSEFQIPEKIKRVYNTNTAWMPDMVHLTENKHVASGFGPNIVEANADVKKALNLTKLLPKREQMAFTEYILNNPEKWKEYVASEPFARDPLRGRSPNLQRGHEALFGPATSHFTPIGDMVTPNALDGQIGGTMSGFLNVMGEGDGTQVLKQLGYDGVKYPYNRGPAWAIPDPAQIKIKQVIQQGDAYNPWAGVSYRK